MITHWEFRRNASIIKEDALPCETAHGENIVTPPVLQTAYNSSTPAPRLRPWCDLTNLNKSNMAHIVQSEQKPCQPEGLSAAPFGVSMISVTGPSLHSSTCIIAPNTPCCTSAIPSARSASQYASYNDSA